MCYFPYESDFKANQVYEVETGGKNKTMTVTKTGKGLKLIDNKGFGHSGSISQFIYNFNRSYKLVATIKYKHSLYSEGKKI